MDWGLNIDAPEPVPPVPAPSCLDQTMWSRLCAIKISNSAPPTE